MARPHFSYSITQQPPIQDATIGRFDLRPKRAFTPEDCALLTDYIEDAVADLPERLGA